MCVCVCVCVRETAQHVSGPTALARPHICPGRAGFTAGTAYTAGGDGAAADGSIMDILADDVACTGSESSFLDCSGLWGLLSLSPFRLVPAPPDLCPLHGRAPCCRLAQLWTLRRRGPHLQCVCVCVRWRGQGVGRGLTPGVAVRRNCVVTRRRVDLRRWVVRHWRRLQLRVWRARSRLRRHLAASARVRHRRDVQPGGRVHQHRHVPTRRIWVQLRLL